MDRYIYYIVQNVTWKKVLFFTIVCIFLYSLINFSSIGLAGLLKITDGSIVLDMEFGYNYEKANKILTELGSEGREFYLNKLLPIDFVFPLSYMLFLTVWIAIFLNYIGFNNWYKYFICLPIFPMLFDWIENIGIIVMLKNYPNLSEWVVYGASFATVLKFISVTVNVVL